MATVSPQPAPLAMDPKTALENPDVLNMHKDRISAAELNLKDPYGKMR
jgi:hypothetical protein